MFEYVINKNSTILFSMIMYFQHGGQMIEDYVNLLSFSVNTLFDCIKYCSDCFSCYSNIT